MVYASRGAGVDAKERDHTHQAGMMMGMEWKQADDGWWWRRVGSKEWQPMPSRTVVRIMQRMRRLVK